MWRGCETPPHKTKMILEKERQSYVTKRDQTELFVYCSYTTTLSYRLKYVSIESEPPPISINPTKTNNNDNGLEILPKSS
jgi:hypothetical protein